MKIKGWVLFGLMAMSSVSWAASNSENLRALYEMGLGPATPCDFSKTDFNTGLPLETSANTCVIIGPGDRPYYYDIARVVRVTQPAGPLVPGKTEEKLVYGNVKQSFDLMPPPRTLGRDLIIDNPIYRTWLDGSNGATHFVPAQLFVRESGQYLAFRLSIPHDIPGFQDEEYFGYCYGPMGKILIDP